MADRTDKSPLISSVSSDALSNLMPFLPKDTRRNFISYLESEKAFSFIVDETISGEPFYMFSVKNGAVTFDYNPEFISPKHMQSIQAYIEAFPNGGRTFVDPLIFISAKQHPDKAPSHVIAIPISLLKSRSETLTDQQSLTLGELRLLAQLLGGMTVRQTSATDGVSYETRRGQLKSILLKFNISRQSDLITELTNTILIDILTRPRSEDQGSTIEKYVDMYFPKKARLQNYSLTEGRYVSVIELGPVSGDPVVLCHAMYLGDLDDDFIQSLEDLNLRIVAPLRAGYFDSAAKALSHKEHFAHALDSLNLVYELLGQKKMTLMCISGGSYYASKYVNRFPDRVSEVVFIGAGGHTNSPVPTLIKSLSSLALSNPVIVAFAIKFYAKHYGTSGQIRKMLESLFEDSPRDMEVIARNFGPPHFGQQMQTWVETSALSIAQDYYFRSKMDWSELDGLPLGITFIHGVLDQLAPIRDLNPIIDAIDTAKLCPINSMAHLAMPTDRFLINGIIRKVLDKSSF